MKNPLRRLSENLWMAGLRPPLAPSLFGGRSDVDLTGKRILVIGHSNTLLPLIRSLNAKPDIDSIADKDYGNLFIIHKSRKTSGYSRKRF